MGKAFHKPTPAPPPWYWPMSDGCWWCKYRNNQRGCTGCKVLKQIVAKKEKQKRKKERKVDF